MSNQFPIADMLTMIRNGLHARKASVIVPASKFKTSVLDVLLNNGFINSHKQVEVDSKPFTEIALKYDDRGEAVIKSLAVSSKPSRRVYEGVKTIPQVKNNFGVVIMSTPKGVMSGQQAVKLNVGGEEICTVF